nr:DUF983 domain-containing protein [Octadecabacter arcticus]
MLKCPSCGVGKTLHKYLKVKDNCDHCGIDLHHASVDDGPAYFTLMVVVGLILPFLPIIYANYDPNPLLVAFALMGAATVLALWLLPRTKELLSNLVFEYCWSCGDLVGVCGFDSVFERDACDDFCEVVKAA